MRFCIKLNTEDKHISPVEVTNLTIKYANATQRVFHFTITNRHNSTVSSISWTLDTGQSSIASTQNTTLAAGESTLVYVYHNYTAAGTYEAIATAMAGGAGHSQSIGVVV